MSFVKYQHIERLGTPEVEGITLGECWVFPKLDGSNACIWRSSQSADIDIRCGSRNRELGFGKDDNHGFNTFVMEANFKGKPSFGAFFTEYPFHRLYGEWLVPHSLKTYREGSWRDFYVFDVCTTDFDGGLQYLSYDQYQPLLDKFGINYIPPIKKIINGSYEDFVNCLPANNFLIEDGKGQGEGIVIKNYQFRNKFGRTTWAKIVTSEFKELHTKTMGCGTTEKHLIEQQVAEKFVTTALVEKEHAKIVASGSWESKMIPQLLNTVFYSLVKEDAWNFVKAHKMPVIDFRRLQHFVFAKVKTVKPELF
jgi:hypothetical protein